MDRHNVDQTDSIVRFATLIYVHGWMCRGLVLNTSARQTSSCGAVGGKSNRRVKQAPPPPFTRKTSTTDLSGNKKIDTRVPLWFDGIAYFQNRLKICRHIGAQGPPFYNILSIHCIRYRTWCLRVMPLVFVLSVNEASWCLSTAEH